MCCVGINYSAVCRHYSISEYSCYDKIDWYCGESITKAYAFWIQLAVTNFTTIWGALLFLTHVFLGILSSLQTIIAEQFSINIITQLANKLTQVKNLNFFENKDHTIKLNTIHNGLHIRPLNYVSNLFFNLQRIIGLISLFGILFSISIYLPFIMIFATVPCILISNHIAKKHSASIDKLQDQKESMQNYLYSGLDNQKNKDNLLFNFMLNFHHKFIETKELYLNNFVKVAQKT